MIYQPNKPQCYQYNQNFERYCRVKLKVITVCTPHRSKGTFLVNLGDRVEDLHKCFKRDKNESSSQTQTQKPK